MGYMAPKLKQRIQICIPVETPNDRGGMDRTYETLLTVWAERKSLLTKFYHYVSFIRGQNVKDDLVTEAFVVRNEAVRSLGREYSKAFYASFDSIEDLNPLKSNYYILEQRGSTVKGRLYRIEAVEKDDEFREHILFRCKEIEEKGTGTQEAYPL